MQCVRFSRMSLASSGPHRDKHDVHPQGQILHLIILSFPLVVLTILAFFSPIYPSLLIPSLMFQIYWVLKVLTYSIKTKLALQHWSFPFLIEFFNRGKHETKEEGFCHRHLCSKEKYKILSFSVLLSKKPIIFNYIKNDKMKIAQKNTLKHMKKQSKSGFPTL